MALELYVNSPTPGAIVALGTLAAPINTAPAPGTVETYAVSAAAPTGLRSASGQFRVVIDSEIMIVAASASGASPWTFTRGAEGSTPHTHPTLTQIFHFLTAGALAALPVSSAQGQEGVNLGAAQTLDYLGAATRKQLVGVVNADLTVTLSNTAAGSEALLPLTQDGTGSHALIISDGTNTLAVAIATAPGALTIVAVYCPAPGVLKVVVLGGSGMPNPMTTAGDLIVAASGGVPARLAKGTDGQVLTMASGLETWAAGGVGGALTISGGAPTSVFTTGISGGTP